MNKFTLCLLMCFNTIVASAQLTVKDTIFNRADYEDFGFGADISWLSQQESWGTYYNNRAGKRTDLMKILKEDFGLNALRFRVWVNPSGGWSGKQDVINLCKRAHALGFKIMISFHYSDTWADSSNQTIPGQWTDHSVSALEQKVYEHTKDVLSGLKAAGIIPVWVSLGNETKYGMLYDVGRTKTTEGYQNFVRFINAGAKAVEEISPDIIKIIHLPNGHDESTARNMFTNLDKYGANYDAIGLSAYPRWSHLDITTDAQITSTINKYMTTFKNLKAKFKKPVIVMETGHYVDQPYDANRFLSEFMKALVKDGELGCFYWEPEASSGYNLGAWDGNTHQATIAMDAYMGVKHTKVDKYFSIIMLSPKNTDIFPLNESLDLKISARTTTDITSVNKVDFYLNNKLLSTAQPAYASQSIFSCPTDPLSVGKYTFHAIVHDTQGHVESTDTVSFLVGNMAKFDESSPCFDSSSYTDFKVNKSISGYSGTGYIGSTSTRDNLVSWNIFFPEAGTYTMFVRYNSDKQKTFRCRYGEKSTYITSQVTDNTWDYSQSILTIPEEGVYKLDFMSLLSNGIPNIDYIAISSPEGVELVQDGTTTGINNISVNLEKPTPIYDLQGRVVAKPSIGTNSMEELHPGIYIVNGKKFVVR